MKMKKNFLILGFIICLLTMNFAFPVEANGPIHSHWAAFPIIDPENDVYNHTERMLPKQGQIGDYDDGIDITYISLNDSDNISITFAGNPSFQPSLNIFVYIDINSNGSYEYQIIFSTGAYLQRTTDYAYWNWSSQTWGALQYLQYGTSGNATVFMNIADAIPQIASASVRINVRIINETGSSDPYYTDLAPNGSSGGTPPIDPLLVVLGITIIVATVGGVGGIITYLVKKRR